MGAQTKSRTSPTTRTLNECRKRKWLVGTVERFQFFAEYHQVVKAAKTLDRKAILAAVRNLKARSTPGVRQDLFGFLDVLAMTGEGVVGIQSTSHSNIRARFLKMRDDKLEHVRTCLRSGVVVEIWGWRYFEKKVERRNWWPTILRFMADGDGAISAKFPTGVVKKENEF